jgi:hypothetical protein
MKFNNKELELVTRALRMFSVELADDHPFQAKEANEIRIKKYKLNTKTIR